MKQVLCAVGITVFLLCGTLWARPWSDWVSASNNVNIAYHFRLWEDAQSCDMEFKDVKQGDGYTTFDAAVDYQTQNTDPSNTDPNKFRITKTQTVHIVISASHNGIAQVRNCSGISDVRVSFIQRK